MECIASYTIQHAYPKDFRKISNTSLRNTSSGNPLTSFDYACRVSYYVFCVI